MIRARRTRLDSAHVAVPALDLRASIVKVALAGLIAVKLWFLLFVHLGEWTTYARVSLPGVAWVVGSAIVLAAIGLWWRGAIRRGRVGEGRRSPTGFAPPHGKCLLSAAPGRRRKAK